jgi:hypothetical protein
MSILLKESHGEEKLNDLSIFIQVTKEDCRRTQLINETKTFFLGWKSFITKKNLRRRISRLYLDCRGQGGHASSEEHTHLLAHSTAEKYSTCVNYVSCESHDRRSEDTECGVESRAPFCHCTCPACLTKQVG